MIKDEEIQRLIKERLDRKPTSEAEAPIEHSAMDTVDETGAYQVYEITYKKSVQTGKQVIAEYLGRQEARDLVRKYRNALSGDDVMKKGYGFEKMSAVPDVD